MESRLMGFYGWDDPIRRDGATFPPYGRDVQTESGIIAGSLAGPSGLSVVEKKDLSPQTSVL